MNLSPEIIDRISKLEEKFTATGQNLLSYLDGLLYADYLTYWDYIHLDTLLSLQNPKTKIPDESIFIMYHQVTELYFKLSMHEFEQVTTKSDLTLKDLVRCITRVNRYFSALIDSFDIMVDGLDKQQFHQFRMSLLPASGFQSAQYRMLEIYATDFSNLVAAEDRAKFNFSPKNEQEVAAQFEHIYWKQGATELASGKKTLTLIQFEEKYEDRLLKLAQFCRTKNLLALIETLPEADRKNQELLDGLKMLDVNINVNWPLSHYKSAVRYLQADPEDIAATGGTNWQKYLPPRFQRRIFYPSLWTEEELTNWGKSWVRSVVFGEKK